MTHRFLDADFVGDLDALPLVAGRALLLLGALLSVERLAHLVGILNTSVGRDGQKLNLTLVRHV